ncbi:MAG: tyrosine-type recombinase/integrase [Chloroflexi bacterium]|nr:tyrosine-type recombinase/integrase [Chloroflexota bacterium]
MPRKPEQLTDFNILKTDKLTAAYRDFLMDVEAANRTAKTVRFYRQTLAVFLDFLRGQGADSVQEIKAAHIRAYLAHLSETHTAGGVHAHYRALRAFIRFLLRDDALEKDPLRNVRPPRVDLDLLDPVSIEHLQALLETCTRRETIDHRDRAILLTLLDTGLRAGELCALNVGDVNLATGEIPVRRSKSRKPRTVYAGHRARLALTRYLRTRPDARPDDPLWLTFPINDAPPDRLTYGGLRQMVRRRAGRAGIPVPSLHSFRRAFAILSLRNGADPVSISRMLGHGSLPVVMRYLRQLSQDLGEVHKSTSPVDRLKL